MRNGSELPFFVSEKDVLDLTKKVEALSWLKKHLTVANHT